MIRDHHRHRRAHIEAQRGDIERRRQEGGFDESALKWAEWYLDQAEALLSEQDFETVHEGVHLAYVDQATRYLVWAREPVRDKERQSERGKKLRSDAKQAALRLYREADTKPRTIKEFMRLLDEKRVDYASSDAVKTFNKVRNWFEQARNKRAT